jgi:AraC-like DNA-binding protein
MDQIRIPHFAPARLEALGFSPVAVLRQAHLPLSLLHQERLVLSTAQWFALWRAIEALSSDPALGLKFGGDIPVEHFDPIFIAALCARSFHEALINVARYKHQFCAEELRIMEHDGWWQIDVVWNATKEPAPPLLVDGMFASHMALGQRGSGLALHPERVTFRRPPLHRAMYEGHFQCPVDFDAAQDLVVYSRQAIEAPFLTFNPDMLSLLIPQLETLLRDDATPQTISDQVKTLLKNRLPNKHLTMQNIAQEVNVSIRTLQRQLANEGTSFQQVLDIARRELAEHYLRASSLDLNEIAYLLGYEETSSFHRAFHNWNGTSPGQWRSAQQQ